MTREKLSAHFTRAEFRCRCHEWCGGAAPVSDRLIEGVELLRGIVGRPIVIVSGFRCPRHNEAVGGSVGSYHTFGMAADVCVPPGMTREEFSAAVAQVEVFALGGVGRYYWGFHLDVRSDGPARWGR